MAKDSADRIELGHSTRSEHFIVCESDFVPLWDEQ